MKIAKRIIAFLMTLFVMTTLISVMPVANIKTQAASTKAMDDKRACWIAYIDIQTYLSNKSEAAFRAKVNEMYDNVKANSMDTVIVHARAMGDAMYPSSYYPFSTYISSTRKSLGYDPFKIMVDLAHEKGLKFEAWINPYRLSISDATTNSFKATGYYDKYKDMILEYKNSGNETCLALDPGNEKARNLIINGAKEIVQNYDVDAIHFDDYFYVTGMDYKLKEQFHNDAAAIDAAKKNNVNLLVKNLYSAIKSVDPNCQFGISPAGNLDNARAQGADVDTWMSQSGYVDYIMPQIYWTDNYKLRSGITKMYSNRCNLWQSINKNDIPIYVGLALYRVGVKDSYDLDWALKNDNLSIQYLMAHNMGYDGYALFRYAWLENSIAKTELANLKAYADDLRGDVPKMEDTYVAYSTHVQSYGWQGTRTDGVVAGTTGSGKRLEAIKIQLGELAGEGGITYRTHVQSYGWQKWKSDGELSGTTGEAKRLEAIEIKLTGKAAENYDVYYRVHCQSYGWLDWAKNGEAAGTASYAKRLEAIQIKIVKKGDAAPGPVGKAYVSRIVKYQTHVQTYGWQDAKYDGEMSGTSGQRKRLEAIKIQLIDQKIEGGIRYRVHCQTYGWLPWVSDGAMSGTSGQAKRLEAIEIELTGDIAEVYDIYYRVHCQTYGWLPWVKNGEMAGTSGQAKRLEGIEIKLVPKK